MKYLSILFIVISILITSCTKSPESKIIPSKISISAMDAKALITTNFPFSSSEQIYLLDAKYILPTTSWVSGDFSSRFKDFLFAQNIKQASPDKNDCDKFSIYGRSVANILNYHNPNGLNQGIAVGEVHVLLSNGAGHMMNFIIVADQENKPQIIFYEPQYASIVALDTNQAILLNWRM